jgi:D-alanine transaminase
MSRIAYVNGSYRPLAEAAVHIEDRGFQFADGVYEVCEIRDGMVVDETRHLDRLWRSLGELAIAEPMGRQPLRIVMHEVMRRNRVHDGLVYIQVTRGAARRDFVFPDPPVSPSLIVLARSTDRAKSDALAATGIAVVTLPESRWARVDIKSVSLLPNVLAKEAAKRAGAREAWFVDRDGYVTEGGSSNAWIVTDAGEIVTRSADHGILRGITRTTLLDLFARDSLGFVERPFTVAEAKAAREAFVSAATALIMPVVRIDGAPVGDGRPGPIATRLRAAFHTMAEKLLI